MESALDHSDLLIVKFPMVCVASLVNYQRKFRWWDYLWNPSMKRTKLIALIPTWPLFREPDSLGMWTGARMGGGAAKLSLLWFWPLTVRKWRFRSGIFWHDICQFNILQNSPWQFGRIRWAFQTSHVPLSCTYCINYLLSGFVFTKGKPDVLHSKYRCVVTA